MKILELIFIIGIFWNQFSMKQAELQGHHPATKESLNSFGNELKYQSPNQFPMKQSELQGYPSEKENNHYYGNGRIPKQMNYVNQYPTKHSEQQMFSSLNEIASNKFGQRQTNYGTHYEYTKVPETAPKVLWEKKFAEYLHKFMNGKHEVQTHYPKKHEESLGYPPKGIDYFGINTIYKPEHNQHTSYIPKKPLEMQNYAPVKPNYGNKPIYKQENIPQYPHIPKNQVEPQGNQPVTESYNNYENRPINKPQEHHHLDDSNKEVSPSYPFYNGYHPEVFPAAGSESNNIAYIGANSGPSKPLNHGYHPEEHVVVGPGINEIVNIETNPVRPATAKNPNLNGYHPQDETEVFNDIVNTGMNSVTPLSPKSPTYNEYYPEISYESKAGDNHKPHIESHSVKPVTPRNPAYNGYIPEISVEVGSEAKHLLGIETNSIKPVTTRNPTYNGIYSDKSIESELVLNQMNQENKYTTTGYPTISESSISTENHKIKKSKDTVELPRAPLIEKMQSINELVNTMQDLLQNDVENIYQMLQIVNDEIFTLKDYIKAH